MNQLINDLYSQISEKKDEIAVERSNAMPLTLYRYAFRFGILL